MKRLLLAWVIVLAGGYLLVFGGSSTKNLGSKKVAIEIATPQGTVRGSSVFDLTHSTAPWWYPSAVTSSTGIKGEAPYADLGSGRYVFMLLHDHLYQKTMVSWLIERSRGGANSPYDYTPMFVTFDNIEDATSVREVDRNALDRTFGPGYRLVSLTVTDTREHATQGMLAKKFPALHSALLQPGLERKLTPKTPTTPGQLEPFQPDIRRIDWGSFDSIPRP
jgi:hypothetical protein